MKAVVIDEYGDRSKLHMTNIEIPEIEEDEVLVEVKPLQSIQSIGNYVKVI